MKRDTNTELMNNVFELVKKNQCYEKAEKIIDYFLPEIFDVIEISDCDFIFMRMFNLETVRGYILIVT